MVAEVGPLLLVYMYSEHRVQYLTWPWHLTALLFFLWVVRGVLWVWHGMPYTAQLMGVALQQLSYKNNCQYIYKKCTLSMYAV